MKVHETKGCRKYNQTFFSEEIITDSIRVCRVHGIGVAAVRTMDTIMRTNDGKVGTESVSRTSIIRIQTPQACLYGKVAKAHEEALEKGITSAVYTNTLMLDLGETLYFSKGSAQNIKITRMEDVGIFKALYRLNKEDWVK